MNRRGLLRAGGPWPLLVLLVFAGCTLMIPGREAKVGARYHAVIEQTMGLVEDPDLTAYVRKIGDRLAAHSTRDVEYRFFVVNMQEPNAFALPGGYIYVSRGLLVLPNSEDELAGVIGHEIGHVQARHHLRSQMRSVPFIPLTVAGAIAGFAASLLSPELGQGIMSASTFPAAAVLSSHSRSAEREADEIGQQLAAQAGWDPLGLSRFLTTLAREERVRGGDPERRDFFASHPPSPERSAATRERAGSLERADTPPIAGTHAAFLGRLDGLLVGLSGAEGVFVDRQFLHPDLDFAVAFPAGWKASNSPQAVAARDPEKDAFVILQTAGKGVDPVQAARDFHASSGGRLLEGPTPLQVGGLNAARTLSQSSRGRTRVTVEATWIAHGGLVFVVAGMAVAERFGEERATMRAVADSFRPISAAERAQVTEERLRLRTAGAGEKFDQIRRDTGTTWTAQSLAVANGLDLDGQPAAGALLKIPVPQPYPPR
ncbi:MAG: M48 family metalloprotease [Deltaproteobacteria bacterium]|nr:M48 family metalloprotease [Deltaproteobacteria bacterium]